MDDSMNKNIEGLLLVNKPKGISSRQMLDRVKRRLGKLKMGHCGTLDPAAEGLLIVGLGRATRTMEHLLQCSKKYRAYALLGMATDSGDLDGEVIETTTFMVPARERIQTVLNSLCGEITQTVPKFSALKHKGQRFYKLARSNQEVPVRKRKTFIYQIHLGDIKEDGFWFDVECSKGTYIRTLVEDIGSALGTVACLASLERLSIGSFTNQEALSAESIDQLPIEKIIASLIPTDQVFNEFSALQLDAELSQSFCCGRFITLLGQGSEKLRIYDKQGRFLGIGQANIEGIKPVKVWG